VMRMVVDASPGQERPASSDAHNIRKAISR